MSSAPSKRTGPRVNRDPSRISDRLSVPTGGVLARVLRRPFHSPTISTPGDRPGDRDAVVQDVILDVAVGRRTEDAETDVAHDPHRLDRLAEQKVKVEVGRIESEAARLPSLGSRVENLDRHGRPARRLGHEPDLGADDRVVEIVGRGPRDVSRSASGAGAWLVTDSESWTPPFSWSSAIGLTPKLKPNVPSRQRFPVSPEAG